MVREYDGNSGFCLHAIRKIPPLPQFEISAHNSLTVADRKMIVVATPMFSWSRIQMVSFKIFIVIM
jgi:hypothetical protein